MMSWQIRDAEVELQQPQDSCEIFYIILSGLLPICDVKNSGIVDDPKKNYFSDVETFSAATNLTLDS